MPIDPTKAKRLKAYDHKCAFQSLALEAPRLYAGSDDYGIHVFDLSAEDAAHVWCKRSIFGSFLNEQDRPTVYNAIRNEL